MQHAVFFEALADIPEHDPDWHAVFLGYLTIRLFDDWLELGPIGTAMKGSIGKIEQLLPSLTGSHDAERIAIERILTSLVNAPDTNPGSVADPLLAYALLLEENHSWWNLAADIYDTVSDAVLLRASNITANVLIAAHARRRQAICLRNMRDYQASENAYQHAIFLAERGHDDATRLLAKMGLANLSRARGNLPAAVTAFEQLLTESTSCSPEVLPKVMPRILHNYGTVKHDMGLHEEAVLDLFAAYKAAEDEAFRDFALVDLGVAANDAGHRSIAKHALGFVAMTTQSLRARQMAIVNLIDIAVRDGNQVEFETRRREWNPKLCEPLFNSAAYFYIAQGIERFIGRQEAIQAYREAANFATRAGIHKKEFEALQEIERLERNQQQGVQAPLPIASPPESLRAVADALQELYLMNLATHQEF